MMLNTEEEARKRMCPIADNARLKGDTCVASGCMAWRWTDAEADEKEGWTWRRMSKRWDEAGWYHPGDPSSNRVLLPRRGFCGLAGSPTQPL